MPNELIEFRQWWNKITPLLKGELEDLINRQTPHSFIVILFNEQTGRLQLYGNGTAEEQTNIVAHVAQHLLMGDNDTLWTSF